MQPLEVESRYVISSHTLLNTDYLSIVRFKLTNVDKRGPTFMTPTKDIWHQLGQYDFQITNHSLKGKASLSDRNLHQQNKIYLLEIMYWVSDSHWFQLHYPNNSSAHFSYLIQISTCKWNRICKLLSFENSWKTIHLYTGKQNVFYIFSGNTITFLSFKRKTA